MSVLNGKRILLGVCGSIAAFKAVALASQLNQAGAEVTTILTKDAARFVTPLSFYRCDAAPSLHATSITPDPGQHSAHRPGGRSGIYSLSFPATAHTLARLAQGLSDDLLTCTYLSTRAPVLVAPGHGRRHVHQCGYTGKHR